MEVRTYDWIGLHQAALMAGTGMRIEEARRLRWEWFDFDPNVLAVRAVKGRNHDEPDIRMNDLPDWLVKRELDRAERVGTAGLIAGAPGAVDSPDTTWDRSNNAKAMRVILDGAGHPWAVPHTFRRTVVTLLHQAGPIGRIADQVGHDDVTTTQKH